MTVLFWDVEITPEEEERYIRMIAEKIHQSGFGVVGILLLESVKPLSFIGSQMGRFFLSPYLPALGEKIGVGGEKLFQIFEKHENMERLISIIEELEQGEKKKSEKDSEKEAAKLEEEGEKETAKKGWRRFLPF